MLSGILKYFFSSRFNFRIQYSTEWVHFRSGTGCRNPCFYTWTGHVSISGRWRIYYFSRIRLFCCIETGEQCFIKKKCINIERWAIFTHITQQNIKIIAYLTSNFQIRSKNTTPFYKFGWLFGLITYKWIFKKQWNR